MAQYKKCHTPKTFRDRDIIQDKQGRIYVVLGYIQPEERVICFLKYVPDSKGRWVSNGINYRRVFWGGVESATTGFAEIPSEYIVHDRHFQTELPEVPREDVATFYLPENRLHEILQEGPADSLEARAKKLAEFLNDAVGIPLECIGVSGSVAWKAHNPLYSDINMNVYGFENSWRLQEIYETLGNQAEGIRIREEHDWELAKRRLLARTTALSMKDLSALFLRRRAIYCDGLSIGVTPILYPQEAPITYGSETYETLSKKPINVRMTVMNDDYSIFLPALVTVTSDPVPELDGLCVNRLMIYEGAFRGLVRTGDILEAVGTPQRVVKKTGRTEESFIQLMVGTKTGAGREYIRLL